ncbi:hypothetical protein [Yoonia sp.]|uniref:hypothetical protein n=1 Tax=Yoonia sp. TaxID=2212373 RepID=UPI0019D9DEBE|nr:hypothetical protein [Yoonia sp.]MBE0413190.1 hypothetical protein [Yoonia sp.]
MILRAGMVAAALALSACAMGLQAARPFDDQAVQKLYNLTTPEYYATTGLGSLIAQKCARYTYDSVLDVQVNEKRNEVGRGSLSAMALRDAIDLETDVTKRSFAAKHGVDMDAADDLCAAADGEMLEGSALSAVLIPV